MGKKKGCRNKTGWNRKPNLSEGLNRGAVYNGEFQRNRKPAAGKPGRSDKEYAVINLRKEYGPELTEVRYAIVSELGEEELRKKYAEELKRFEPFICLTEAMGNAIRESILNTRRHTYWSMKHEIPLNSESVAENVLCFRAGDGLYFAEDPLILVIRQEEMKKELKERNEIPDLCNEILKIMTPVQRRRFVRHFRDNLTERQIAEMEHVSKTSVHQSIMEAVAKAEEASKKYFS